MRCERDAAASDGQFKRRVALSDPKLVDEVAAIEAEKSSICSLLMAEHDKSALRRLLIEPFFRILHLHDVVWSRELPLNHMRAALFDWVGLEKTAARPRPASAPSPRTCDAN